MTERDILRSSGYDPDDPVPRDDEGQRIIPDRLLADLSEVPVVDEADINACVDTGRRIHAMPSRRIEGVLTPRESETLQHLSRGLTSAQTAAALYLGLETIKTHLRTARWRLGAKTTTQACCEAIRRGLIP